VCIGAMMRLPTIIVPVFVKIRSNYDAHMHTGVR
jgi:hypothetical protein